MLANVPVSSFVGGDGKTSLKILFSHANENEREGESVRFRHRSWWLREGSIPSLYLV